MSEELNIMWFRRDLRLHDNKGLYHALKQGNVQPIFIFDSNILSKLTKSDKRVSIIYAELEKIQKTLSKYNASLKVFHGEPVEIFSSELEKTFPNIKALYCNGDYEPYARERDKKVKDVLAKKGITFNDFKDHVIFEKDEVLNQESSPYGVFTPYSKTWKAKLEKEHYKEYPSQDILENFTSSKYELPSLSSIGFDRVEVNYTKSLPAQQKLASYPDKRDYPAQEGTTQVSVALRFGMISIRELVRKALKENAGKYLDELIWRDFYQMILWHHPHVKDRSYKAKYDAIEWENKEQHFEFWCRGETGVPIVDAGMRELNTTGYMHNRVRMIVASFLVKNLLVDWRWGEAYFAEKLLDFDLASNNGGWQWAAGSGCDAAPYFRVFNPITQAQKFDPEMKYIKKWVPEIANGQYKAPIVDIKSSRLRALDRYKQGLDRN